MTYFAESERLIPATKQVLSSGLLTVDGNFSDLVKINATVPSSADVLGGTGQLVRNPSLGTETYRFVKWDAITIPSGQTAGNFIVAVEDSGNGTGTRENPAVGTVIIIDNDGSGAMTPKQQVSNMQLGAITLIGGVIVTAFVVGSPATSRANLPSAAFTALAPFNFASGQGFLASPILNDILQIAISAGSAFSKGVAAISDIETPDTVIRAAVSPIPLIGLVDPVTGSVVLSATAEMDPELVSKKGDIVAFSDAGGGFTTVQSNGHGLDDGSIATITNTTNYNGSFSASNIQPNFYDIPVTFVADDATGNWTGLASFSNILYTGQRIDLLPASGVVGILYGLDTYSSIDDYNQSNGEFSEGFVAPGITQLSIGISLVIIRRDTIDFDTPSNFLFRVPTVRIKP